MMTLNNNKNMICTSQNKVSVPSGFTKHCYCKNIAIFNVNLGIAMFDNIGTPNFRNFDISIKIANFKIFKFLLGFHLLQNLLQTIFDK